MSTLLNNSYLVPTKGAQLISYSSIFLPFLSLFLLYHVQACTFQNSLCISLTLKLRVAWTFQRVPYYIRATVTVFFKYTLGYANICVDVYDQTVRVPANLGKFQSFDIKCGGQNLRLWLIKSAQFVGKSPDWSHCKHELKIVL